MATTYIYGTALTAESIASNNRGELLGNISTLQKTFHNGILHTSISGEAIRFALRFRFQLENLNVNRSFDVQRNIILYKDERHTSWNPDNPYVDDDLMGFMTLEAARSETSEPATQNKTDDAKLVPKTPKKRSKSKINNDGTPNQDFTFTVRHSPLSIGRAISLRPYRGETALGTQVGTDHGNRIIYTFEIHSTEYQYSFGVNLSSIVNKTNISHLLNAIVDPGKVGGSHTSCLYDFSPVSIVLRVTTEHSSRIQNVFDVNNASNEICVSKLIDRIKSGDLPASELIVGGEIMLSSHGKVLVELGVQCFDGVKSAMNAAKNKIAAADSSLSAVQLRTSK